VQLALPFVRGVRGPFYSDVIGKHVKISLMRLLQVTQSYYPFLAMGGPTVKVRALAKGLASSGNKVTVLSVDLGLDSQRQEVIGAVPTRWGFEAKENGVEAVYLRTRARYRALTWNPGVRVFCRERLSGFDLIHIYGLYDFLGPQVASECRRTGRPYVVEPMGMFLPIVRNIRMKRLYHATLGGSLIRGASRVIATAEQERQEFLNGGIPDSKIVVRRNGIDVPPEFPPFGSFRDRWKIAREAKLILFLGRLVSKKSPDLMLEVFSLWNQRGNGARGSALVIVGPDEGDGFREHLELLAAKTKHSGKILFTGPLYGNDKWAAYRDADVFVLPSQNENFGNTAAEAIASGTPVLVTDRCGIAPIVEQGAGLVVPHDCYALEAGMARILEDPAFASQLRDGCMQVRESLSWAEPLAQMEALYEAVISEHRGP
jgi:glycosyltransferase involved in cell wall biosynthesis